MVSTRNFSPSFRLPKEFYFRDTKTVAKDLLGKRLVRVHNGRRIAGIIVETEAYLGIKDRAAHTFGGRRTARNEVMWGEGGHAYVYFVYGMHYCINVVTRSKGQPEAVLLRAIECTEGLDIIQKIRRVSEAKRFGNGPGNLCQALDITRDFNGVSLLSDALFIEWGPWGNQHKPKIITRPRVGVDYAGVSARWPLRYYVYEHPCVSKR